MLPYAVASRDCCESRGETMGESRGIRGRSVRHADRAFPRIWSGDSHGFAHFAAPPVRCLPDSDSLYEVARLAVTGLPWDRFLFSGRLPLDFAADRDPPIAGGTPRGITSTTGRMAAQPASATSCCSAGAIIRAVHEEGYEVVRDSDGTLHFSTPRGCPIPEVPLQPAVPRDPVPARVASNRAHGLTIDARTGCRTGWASAWTWAGRSQVHVAAGQ
jgi:hypothetical protein